MNASAQKRGQDEKPIQCFFRVSIGGEILEKDIVVELDMENYPKTSESFLSMCDGTGSTRGDAKDNNSRHVRTSRQSPQPTYRGCEFHRVVPGLCVQAGDWERFDGTGGFSPLYGRNWKDEEGTPGGKKQNKHDREGIVSMANAGKPNTNGSQFFITLKPTPHLDGKHTVFGKVVSGIESVRKMADVERGEKDRPVSLQRIVVEDCGRFSFGQKQASSKKNAEEENLHRSRSKERKRKKKSKKSERKKREKKRHRSRRYESSSSESYSSDDSDSKDDDSDPGKKKCSSKERRSRKHRERKRRRKNYDSSDGDESSGSSVRDDNVAGAKNTEGGDPLEMKGADATER
eukprot:CAMPEP_0116078178 /NCGR_PEP_ID=MMETSP0327-20121206/460_1 /TAXON_ID=44447 /ORGANISM="Pseudo-nitzschia delicatissima, Strain B596" /LENGTH=345 /DNA_ID=CAMNT_0003568699 /DNA_START=67 /DNA_END=1102 /DNA_ORIENTATION=+